MSSRTKLYEKRIINFHVDSAMSEWLEERRQLTGVPTSEFLRRLIKQAVIASGAEQEPGTV